MLENVFVNLVGDGIDGAVGELEPHVTPLSAATMNPKPETSLFRFTMNPLVFPVEQPAPGHNPMGRLATIAGARRQATKHAILLVSRFVAW